MCELCTVIYREGEIVEHKEIFIRKLNCGIHLLTIGGVNLNINSCPQCGRPLFDVKPKLDSSWDSISK